jgi:hypothetical protein
MWNIIVKTGLIGIIMTKRLSMQTNPAGPNYEEEARHNLVYNLHLCLGTAKLLPAQSALGDWDLVYPSPKHSSQIAHLICFGEHFSRHFKDAIAKFYFMYYCL